MLLGELAERLADLVRGRGAGNAKLLIGVARQGVSSGKSGRLGTALHLERPERRASLPVALISQTCRRRDAPTVQRRALGDLDTSGGRGDRPARMGGRVGRRRARKPRPRGPRLAVQHPDAIALDALAQRDLAVPDVAADAGAADPGDVQVAARPAAAQVGRGQRAQGPAGPGRRRPRSSPAGRRTAGRRGADHQRRPRSKAAPGHPDHRLVQQHHRRAGRGSRPRWPLPSRWPRSRPDSRQTSAATNSAAWKAMTSQSPDGARTARALSPASTAARGAEARLRPSIRTCQARGLVQRCGEAGGRSDSVSPRVAGRRAGRGPSGSRLPRRHGRPAAATARSPPRPGRASSPGTVRGQVQHVQHRRPGGSRGGAGRPVQAAPTRSDRPPGPGGARVLVEVEPLSPARSPVHRHPVAGLQPQGGRGATGRIRSAARRVGGQHPAGHGFGFGGRQHDRRVGVARPLPRLAPHDQRPGLVVAGGVQEPQAQGLDGGSGRGSRSSGASVVGPAPGRRRPGPSRRARAATIFTWSPRSTGSRAKASVSGASASRNRIGRSTT
jgi:hypothetical protein